MDCLRDFAAFVAIALFSHTCAGQEKPPWEVLGLESEKLERSTLYHEKSLESKLDVFRDSWAKFLAGESERIKEIQKLLERSQEIMADVNRIVGGPVDEARTKIQLRFSEQFFQPLFRFSEIHEKLDLFFVTQESVKDYLRKGGSLPGFTYDKVSDTASYYFGRKVSSKEKTVEPDGYSLFFPVESCETAEEDLKRQLSAIGGVPTLVPGLLFHELAEMTILQWMRFYDPHFRWFSDGAANAITFWLLRKYVGEDAAKEFAAAYDPSEYSDMEKEVNLSHWMGLAYCIKTPLESEDRLDNARYAYATHEAQRLVEKCGIECVAKILEAAHKGRTNHSENLLAAIKEVTGEDMAKRLRRYQTFETREEGREKYSARVKAATDRKDYPDALSNLLRVWELGGGSLPMNYHTAATFLFLMGEEEAADRAMQEGLELFKRRRWEEDLFALQKLFVNYSLWCRSPGKAHEVAEEVLKVEPDFVPALVVRTYRLGTSGKTSEAKEVARRILELEKDSNSPHFKFAEKVLRPEE